MKIKQLSESIWTIDNFLTPTECNNLVLFSEQKGYEEATVSLTSGAKMMKNIRDNYRLIHFDVALANKYWEKLLQFCPKYIENNEAVGLNEQFRFYKYEAEQRFKRHIDGRFRRSEFEESRITFMIYLNDDYIGGQTKFNDIIITPNIGTALCFIHEQKHEGIPVKKGEKYVLRSDVMYRRITNV
ncbi:oxidoreductase, 2OG-Fe(II) oxygenase [Tenacibaculum sp. Bg11-29]|uniref:2OG-Fe(II) oxygenase n=1 Tax=Tenacibaculum sp. Bg11-29 TaxID=2058306 RepID=UPI000C331E82|nr:2OG-Fe(II) oxygenase [Tenacibaculum sp. Bg11-29]PKH53075.1 oxidoreductase, 2OG-Fe(II) oxygenase [Tenacibaculum sp. Bg11-29]